MSEKYTFDDHGYLVSCFGCEEDQYSPIIYADGSFSILPRGGASEDREMITFGVTGITTPIRWRLAERFLPCHVIEYGAGDLRVHLETFADIVEYDFQRFELAYTRFAVYNGGAEETAFPEVSPKLTALKAPAPRILPGETMTGEYCVYADGLGAGFGAPPSDALRALGGFDAHYEHMRSYWNRRLAGIVQLELPDQRLVDAYKAGFIYTLIVKSGCDLWVGANGYDTTFSHDSIGILQGLFALGDYRYARGYIDAFHACRNNYLDGIFKMPWVCATYLLKTGDARYLRIHFREIKGYIDVIEREIDPELGVIKPTWAIDSNDYWTIDNQAALVGLAGYRFICERLGEAEEARRASRLYDSLLDHANQYIAETRARTGIPYIPINEFKPNSETSRADPRDANWACMFLFGRWSWDGYLFFAPQRGPMLDAVDATYEWGRENRRQVSESPYSFGGFPEYYDCSGYNAGYGSGALRGDRFRDVGIRAYQYMLENTQGGPFSWWESTRIDKASNPLWPETRITGGVGSCPHMWGQSTATKVLIDSVAAVRADGTLIVGRGLPEEWLAEGATIRCDNFPAANGARVNIALFAGRDEVEVVTEGETGAPVFVDLPIFLGKKLTAVGCECVEAEGRVILPVGLHRAVIGFSRETN